MNISLPHISEYGIEVENTGQIHVGIPTTKPLMVKVVDEDIFCLAFQEKETRVLDLAPK